jgi:hypothetical protein
LRFKDSQKVTNNAQWIDQNNIKKWAYCYYNKSPGNNSTYAKPCNLYTAAYSPAQCPSGWHLPANDDTDFPVIIIL